MKIGSNCGKVGHYQNKISNEFSYWDMFIFSGNRLFIHINDLTEQVQSDVDSFWVSVTKIVKINDKGEVVAQGRTLYGEEHALLLIPVKAE